MANFRETRKLLDDMNKEGSNYWNITPEQTGGMSKENVLALLNNSVPTKKLQISNIPFETGKNVFYEVGGTSIKINGLPHVLFYGLKYKAQNITLSTSGLNDGNYIIHCNIDPSDNIAKFKIMLDNVTNADSIINGNTLSSFCNLTVKDKKIASIRFTDNITYYGNFGLITYNGSKSSIGYVPVSDSEGRIY